jgi:hypothetical protein
MPFSFFYFSTSSVGPAAPTICLMRIGKRPRFFSFQASLRRTSTGNDRSSDFRWHVNGAGPLLTQFCFGLLTYFPGVVLFSSIDPCHFDEWEGTLIEAKGLFDGPQKVLGPSLQQYAVCSIEESRSAATEISDKQWKNIEKDILKDKNS